MRLTTILYLIFLFAFPSFGQDGHYYISNYKHTFDYLDYRTQAISQDQNGVMYFAHRNGVMRFDGSEWEFIKSPKLVLDLLVSEKQVFLAGKGGFGYIKQHLGNANIYHAIKDDYLFDFKKIHQIGKKIYFQAEEGIVEYDSELDSITFQWKAYSQRNLYDNSFVLNKQLYVEVRNRGIYVLEKEKISKTGISLPPGDEILFAENFADRSLIGSMKGQLYLFDGKNLDSLRIQDQAYLTESQLLSGKVVDSTHIVLSTLQGGCLLVNILDGKTEQFINYQTGLPDNEIFALGIDRQKGIWLAHEYGFSRIDYQLPIRKFNYHGLQGNILALAQHDSLLYVATNEGVFYLDEIRNYQEIIQYIPKTISKKENSQTRINKAYQQKDSTRSGVGKLWDNIFGKKDAESSGLEELEKKQDSIPEKKGFFKRLFGKKDKKEAKKEEVKVEESKKAETPKDTTKTEKRSFWSKIFGKKDKKEEKKEEPKTEETPVAKTEETNKEKNSTQKKQNKAKNKPKLEQKPTVVMEAHQILALASISHVFKKIDGIDGKIKQLIVTPTGLVAAGNAGIFMIENKKSTKISSQIVRYAYPNKEWIFATNHANQLVAIHKNSQKVETFAVFEDYISRISQDFDGNFWVCGTDSLHKIGFDEKFLSKMAFRIDNPQTEDILPLRYKNRLYFLISQKAYQLSGTQLKADTLFGKDNRLFSQTDQLIWAFNGKTWKSFGKETPRNAFLLQYLNPISELFWQDSSAFLWTINDKNELFRINLADSFNTNIAYDLILKDIHSENQKQFDLENLEFSYDFGALRFNFTLPEFLNGKKVEYQYALEGKMQNWSSWSNSGTVVFPTLESGKYSLKIRSRDVFGNIKESKTIEFRVLPPYWQTLWFMGFEIIFFIGLLFATFIINEKISSQNPYFPWIRSGLTLLTLVLCMEFLEMLLQFVFDTKTDTPVEDFAVEVLLALTVLPFERFLSKFLKRRAYKNEREA